MKTYVLLTEKEWHSDLLSKLRDTIPANWIHISSRDKFSKDVLAELSPEKIFIPHWSYVIHQDIYQTFECVLFHMTDLPYGRGGSPLQNLILRNKKTTKISAIRVSEGLDTGPVYNKASLSLKGTAEEIFIRASGVIYRLIKQIINKNLTPHPQSGEPIYFKRRKPADSNIASLESLDQVYDYIRMVDCEGYPKAYIETETLRIEFTNAGIENKNLLKANATIIKK